MTPQQVTLGLEVALRCAVHTQRDVRIQAGALN
jgi:hypothetical protein